MPFTLHEVPNADLKTVLELLPPHPDSERLHRAISYYHAGISLWRPGSELAVLSHMYMAVETLTPVVLRGLVSQGTSKDALIAEWQIDRKQLDAEVRRRHIFRNDDDAYKNAKWASDGFEHGFAPFDALRQTASQALLATASYVRQAIIEQLALPQDVSAVLLAPPLDQPFFLYYSKYLRGTLVANSDNLAAPDQLYPMLSWKSTRHERPSEPGSDPGIEHREELQLRAADGVKLVDSAIYVFGPGGKAVVRPDSPSVETDQAPDPGN